jgi:dienelactone hydrolase
MRRILLACWFAVCASAGAAEPVTLTAADGVKVFGTFWRADRARAPVVVAFHQAGSSAAEYAPIAPRLVASGYTVLAIDQRAGGRLYGPNRTAGLLSREATYDEALPDLEAALAWAHDEAQGAPVVVLGSSYSAALVFVLAAAHPGDIAAVVAFSPGEYLAAPHAVARAATSVAVPVWIDQASTAEEIAHSAEVLKAVPVSDKTQFVARGRSVHGASTLRPDKNPSGAEAHWTALLAFLGRVTGGR